MLAVASGPERSPRCSSASPVQRVQSATIRRADQPLFEPVLMIVIGLVIGAIVVLMYLPIFDLASSLQ